MKLKLVDALGGEEVAKNWLVKEKGLDKDLKLIDWKPQRDSSGLFFTQATLKWIAGQLGFGAGVPETALPQQLKKRLFLDGLLSIWHVSDGATE